MSILWTGQSGTSIASRPLSGTQTFIAVGNTGTSGILTPPLGANSANISPKDGDIYYRLDGISPASDGSDAFPIAQGETWVLEPGDVQGFRAISQTAVPVECVVQFFINS